MPKRFPPKKDIMPPPLEGPNREEEYKIAKMELCYSTLKAFFVSCCILLFNMRMQADTGPKGYPAS